MSDDELTPSSLGTKAHWDEAYRQENDNFDQNGDEGETWFGEEAMERIIRWLKEHEDAVSKSSSVLDLGCGNGVACLQLKAEGFTDVTGVDYCEDAILLARKIARNRGFGEASFQICDVLQEPHDLRKLFEGKKFDVCLDKGTYDAISLRPDNAQSQRWRYVDNVATVLKDEGLLIMTSCNWTEAELVKHFEKSFSVCSLIPTPQFKFGGVVGNVVSSVVFRRS